VNAELLEAAGLQLRPEEPDDTPFTRRLYASTRAGEMAMVDWTEAQKHAFVASQYDAQRAHYRSAYPEATFDIILQRDRPVGRLYVHRGERDIRLIEITIDPLMRNQGLGRAIISTLLTEAATTQRTVSIHVERFNPAMALYLRLGFRPIDEGPVYSLLEARPTAHF
jgi:RimJ/RimL family protein N-acetyltransferase